MKKCGLRINNFSSEMVKNTPQKNKLILGSLPTILLIIVGESAGGGSVPVGVSDR